MDSDLQHQQYQHHFQGLHGQYQLPKQQMNSGGGGSGAGGGLTRFRSAPSSYISSLMDPAAPGAGAGDLPQPRPLSPETESFLARFVQSVTDAGEVGFGVESVPVTGSLTVQTDFPVTVKQEIDQQFPNTTGYNSSPGSSHQTIHHSSSKPPLARRGSSSIGGSRCEMERSPRVPSMNYLQAPMKMETGRSGSGLTRHRSSPAGLFDDIIVENGYLVNRGAGAESYGSDNNKPLLNSQQLNRPDSSIAMPSVSADAGNLGLTAADANFMNSFPVSSWDDPSLFPDQFPPPEKVVSELNPSEIQVKEEEEESRKRTWGMLAHHLSLPKASLEKLMQLQEDSVPCQMRAKRGRATHPRSIAERVRRTKISERMRKLQDLVPNMDKQTNTSDMLDFAVDYIKDLQRQVQTLAYKRAKCTCPT